MKGLIIFLAACVFTVAMVPLERRAVNTEEEEERLRTQPAEVTTKKPEICAQQTPCAWSVYNAGNQRIEMNITNSFCHCDSQMSCQKNEDDQAVNAFIYRCRPIAEESVINMSES